MNWSYMSRGEENKREGDWGGERNSRWRGKKEGNIFGVNVRAKIS
jgi:hypothetical protein